MVMKRLICPNFHISDNWPFARISAKCAEREKKTGRAKDSLKPIAAFISKRSYESLHMDHM
jgi:hypothetical protein